MENNTVTLDDGITINTVIEETEDNFNVLQVEAGSTGKYKEDYIGQVGNIVHQQNICVLVGTTRYLYDIEFNDGARFCVDREQIEFVEENE